MRGMKVGEWGVWDGGCLVRMPYLSYWQRSMCSIAGLVLHEITRDGKCLHLYSQAVHRSMEVWTEFCFRSPHPSWRHTWWPGHQAQRIHELVRQTFQKFALAACTTQTSELVDKSCAPPYHVLSSSRSQSSPLFTKV